jgi:hypothetical protein
MPRSAAPRWIAWPSSRVVEPLRVAVRPQVDRLVAERGELLEHALAELHPAVVECDRDVHRSLGYGNGRA